MAGIQNTINENNILYELLVYTEWIQDFDNKSALNLISHASSPDTGYFSPWKLFNRTPLQVDHKRFLQTDYPWHLAVSQDGKVIAILQENLLEIRTVKDEYSSIVGKASIPADSCPQLRQLAWSPDNTILAIAHENGTINLYNLLGCNIATIPPIESSFNGMYQPVIGLIFLQHKLKDTKWSDELLIIYYNGVVRSFLLAALDGCDPQDNIKFSFQNYYRDCITSVAYLASHNILIIAGPCGTDSNGITVWRLLNDYPYLKMAFDSPKCANSPRSILRYIPGFSEKDASNTVLKMKISPNGTLLACLHCSGDLSLWHLPGIRPHKRWTLVEQPQHHVCDPTINVSIKNDQHFHPVDITWWSNTALAIARRSGAVTVCSIETLENLLGESPEFFSGPSQIASVYGNRASFITLECEIICNYRNRRVEDSGMESDDENETSVLQASIQAALYSITDIERFQPKRKTPKLIQRTYRLVGLKSTTPEELYSRKIDNEEYDEALTLARTYDLDCDLVYQRQWRKSNVSIESIYSYLEKVSKHLWVANECVERVPDSAAAAKELLRFGLKITNIRNDKSTRTYDDLNAEERKLVAFRRQMLLFLDSLTIYEKIIGSPDKYDSVEFDELRAEPAIAATVKFAHLEDWQAVAIMFTYRGAETLPHWLPILSNFPETAVPLEYRSLLPEVCGEQVVPWEVKDLRELDWCEKEPFLGVASTEKNDELSNKYLYDLDSSLRQFKADVLTPSLVQEWYKRRAYQIEQNSGLVDYALSFVKLARDRNVQNLDRLYFDLLTLESLVYSVQHTDVSFSALEQLSHLDQVKLILAKTDTTTLINDLKNLILPYAVRCEKLGCDTKISLIRGLLLNFSEESLQLPLELLKHLKEDAKNPLNISICERISLALDCIYACPKDDQLETCFRILECLPEKSPGLCSEGELKLHERIDVLENHLEACEILDRYEAVRPVRFILENERNSVIAKQLMEEIAEYTKLKLLDFSELLADLQDLQTKVFTCVSNDTCLEIFASAQMSCECEEIIQSAEDILTCKKGEKGKMIPFQKSVELVLQAARNHFEKGSSFDDPCIKLSETCLKLISEPHSEIHEELDLIESIQLLGVFEVQMLPLQVRLCSNRITLIEACLKARSDAYKSCQRLLQLAQTLRVYGEDRLNREGQVLTMIAQHAYSCADYQYCSDICSRLVTRNYSPAWTTVKLLGQSVEFDNLVQKRMFLAFAVLHCPIENLEELLESRVESRDPVFSRPPQIQSSRNKN